MVLTVQQNKWKSDGKIQWKISDKQIVIENSLVAPVTRVFTNSQQCKNVNIVNFILAMP